MRVLRTNAKGGGVIPDAAKARSGICFFGLPLESRLQSPSMDFALRASLRLFKFVPDEFVRVPPAMKLRAVPE